jgi:O-antigen/teichoic acid export membrane protein
VARGGTLNLASAAISSIASVAITVLITREFSRTVAGTFFSATSAFLIIQALAGLGTTTGMTYFIARLRSLDQESRVSAMLRIAVVPVLVASAVGVVLTLLLANPLARLLLSGHLKHGVVTPESVAATLRTLAFLIPFAALLPTYLGASRGYHDMRPTAWISQIGLSVAQVIAVLIAVLAGSAALLAPLWAVPYAPGVLVAWLWLRRIQRRPTSPEPTGPYVPPELAALLALATPVPLSGEAAPPANENGRVGSRISRRRMTSADQRNFWRFTTPRAVATFTSMMLQRLDIVLVAIMRGPAEAAVYTAATRFLVIGQAAGMAISRAAQPRFTELFALGDRRGANDIYQGTTAWLMLLTWPLYLLAVVYGPQVLAIFGHSYKAGSSVVVILALSLLLATACGQVDMVLITTGRSSWSLINGVLGLVVNIGLDVWLIPRYGILGAAIGWAAAIAAVNLMPLVQLAMTVRLHPFGRGSLVAGALSVASFYVVPVAARALLGGGPKGFLAAAAGGCLVLAIGLWRFHRALRLKALPGVSSIIARRRRGRRPARAEYDDET